MVAIQSGDRVAIHYTGTLEDGTVFDSSAGGTPLEFIAGSDDVIEGLSQAVIGMAVGDQKRISVPPAAGYGERRDGLEQRVPRDMMPEGVREGDPVRANVGEGEAIVLWVVALGDDFATLDGNHPLAGRTLDFEIEIVAVDAASR